MATKTDRKPRSDGLRSRQTILRAAANLATVDGLEGITIGNLAAHIGMSKSGLYAHFGSKGSSSSRPSTRPARSSAPR
jgi:AcrR family transcriptional regulator